MLLFCKMCVSLLANILIVSYRPTRRGEAKERNNMKPGVECSSYHGAWMWMLLLHPVFNIFSFSDSFHFSFVGQCRIGLRALVFEVKEC